MADRLGEVTDVASSERLGSRTCEDPAARGDVLVRAIQVVLCLYLLPIVLIVLALGCVGSMATVLARWLGGSLRRPDSLTQLPGG
jgi:hypothetical protein